MGHRNENTPRMDEMDKIIAIKAMLDYCVNAHLPIPQNIHHYDAYIVEGATHLWEFEAKVDYIEGESEADRDVRRRAWLKDWIKDIARKAAESDGVVIRKKWSSDFEIILTSDEDQFRLVYSVKRDVVCEKKVTGHKVIPEKLIPERIEETFEWVCEDKSLLDD